jgi:hypothetical protein
MPGLGRETSVHVVVGPFRETEMEDGVRGHPPRKGTLNYFGGKK